MTTRVTAARQQFREVERNCDTVWVHESAPVWIVHYEAIEGSRDFGREFWQPYRAIVKPKKGHAVWAHDNKRVGTEGQYRTLDDALEAGAAAAAEWEMKRAA